MLRIDVDQGVNYAVPADNPFADGRGGRAEIFAWGLRNPWRWSFDRQTGELWLADVGQNSWEEVNILKIGQNYGWNIWEGKHCFDRDRCRSTSTSQPEFIEPLLEYGHTDGNCSITGGYVYRGKQIAELNGVYVFADFCSGFVWGGVKDDAGNVVSSLLLKTGLNISSFAEDLKGELYVVDFSGAIHQITNTR
jgi:glucose/arabinose dehydrogenase